MAELDTGTLRAIIQFFGRRLLLIGRQRTEDLLCWKRSSFSLVRCAFRAWHLLGVPLRDQNAYRSPAVT
jgi:hypothetical protein